MIKALCYAYESSLFLRFVCVWILKAIVKRASPMTIRAWLSVISVPS